MSEVIETNPDGTEWITYNGSTTVLIQSGNDAVTQIGNDLTSPAYDFLSSLGDIGITWDIVDGVPVLSGNANTEPVPEATLTPIPDVDSSHNGSNLIEVMKESNSNLNSYMSQQNTILDNQNKLLEESNKINRQIAESLAKAVLVSASHSANSSFLLSQISEHLGVQNAIQAGQIEATLETANATHRVANTQVSVNSKIEESLDYEKTPSIAASNGNTYSPREVAGKSNAEHYIDKKGHNTMDWGAGFIDALDLDDEDGTNSLLALIEKLKTTPFEVINSFDDGRSMTKKE